MQNFYENFRFLRAKWLKIMGAQGRGADPRSYKNFNNFYLKTQLQNSKFKKISKIQRKVFSNLFKNKKIAFSFVVDGRGLPDARNF